MLGCIEDLLPLFTVILYCIPTFSNRIFDAIPLSASTQRLLSSIRFKICSTNSTDSTPFCNLCFFIFILFGLFAYEMKLAYLSLHISTLQLNVFFLCPKQNAQECQQQCSELMLICHNRLLTRNENVYIYVYAAITTLYIITYFRQANRLKCTTH